MHLATARIWRCLLGWSRPDVRGRSLIRVAKENLRNAWPIKVSFQNIGGKQEKDSIIGLLYKWKKNGRRPTSAEVAATSPEVRHYWLL